MSLEPTTRPSLRPFRPMRFGNFTLLAPLGAGGMGEIFLARSTFQGGLDRFCVIKRILPHLATDPEFVTRFLDEIRTLLQLQHGSIAQVYDAGAYGEEYWISLEFVDGKDLRKLLQRLQAEGERLPLELSLFVAIRVLEALAYAHRKKDEAGRELGLVHRDVSPQNVLLSYEGEVKVIDFGLAESKISVARNPAQTVMGKLYYMAPEQGRGGIVDRRSDLYAVGVILWEMLVGRNPHEGSDSGKLLERITDPRLPPIQVEDPSIPPSVASVVDRALSPDPFRRFATAEEMRSRLAACLSERAPEVGPEAMGRWLTRLFQDEYDRERDLFKRLASREEEGSFDPDGETQVIAVSDRLPSPPPGSVTEFFHQGAPVQVEDALPWPDRPYLPEAPQVQAVEAPPLPPTGSPPRSAWRRAGIAAAFALLSATGWFLLRDEPRAATAPEEEPAPILAVEEPSGPPPPDEEPPAAPEDPPAPPEPHAEAPAPAPEPPPARPPVVAALPKPTLAPKAAPPPRLEEEAEDPRAIRDRLLRTWEDLRLRFRRLVDSHGEERVGSIVFQIKEAVDTSMNRFIDEPREYATLEAQLRTLSGIVREREDALR